MDGGGSTVLDDVVEGRRRLALEYSAALPFEVHVDAGELEGVSQHMVRYYYDNVKKKSSHGAKPALPSLQYCCVRVAGQMGLPLPMVRKAFARHWRAVRGKPPKADED